VCVQCGTASACEQACTASLKLLRQYKNLPFELAVTSMETTMSDADQEQQQAQPPELPTASAADRERFEVELEFVQCLASPEYLHCASTCGRSLLLHCHFMHHNILLSFVKVWLPMCAHSVSKVLISGIFVIMLHCSAVLAQQRYFDDPAFMNFLQYLTYWRQPQYAKFIQ
jgi:SOH1